MLWLHLGIALALAKAAAFVLTGVVAFLLSKLRKTENILISERLPCPTASLNPTDHHTRSRPLPSGPLAQGVPDDFRQTPAVYPGAIASLAAPLLSTLPLRPVLLLAHVASNDSAAPLPLRSGRAALTDSCYTRGRSGPPYAMGCG